MIKKFIFVATLAILSSGSADAATYNVSFDGGTLDFTAKIVTDVSNSVTSISGFVNGLDAITGLVPTGTNGLWNYNNIFGASAPWVDLNGILFHTANGVTANLYYTSGLDYVSFTPETISGDYNPGTIGTLTVAAVPVPAAGLMLVSALVGFGALRRRRTT